MREKGTKEIVYETIGEEYVVVVGFGIERYEGDVEAGLSDAQIKEFCYKAKDFYDTNKEKMMQIPLGTQRVIIKKYLNNESIEEFN